jgi:hypothetical protein
MTAVAAALLAACASTTMNKPGAGTHLSAAQEEVAAKAEDQLAAEHQKLYDPTAGRKEETCTPGGAGRVDFGDCWTSRINPTQAQLDEAQRHRRAAAEHRAASQALRDAEARACKGLSEYDRDVSPFAHREDIVHVYPLPNVGAVVVFRHVPTLTAAGLQRIVDCHVARADAMGHQVPEMLYCPLMMRDVTASVRDTNEGFEVTIRSNDPESAREILYRAAELQK